MSTVSTYLVFEATVYNLQKVLEAETEGFSTTPSILYMSILLIQDKDL